MRVHNSLSRGPELLDLLKVRDKKGRTAIAFGFRLLANLLPWLALTFNSEFLKT